MALGDDFNGLKKEQKETTIVKESKGQILIPMPSDGELPRTEEGWQKLSFDIYQTLWRRVNESPGTKEFEIRTVPNINLKGYRDDSRQKKVLKFIEAFVFALDRWKSSLSFDREVTGYGLWGSNGGNAAAKAISNLKRCPVDYIVLIDSKAHVNDVRYPYTVLKGNLSIINTSGDLWSKGDLIGRHNVGKGLKKELPDLNLYWVDSKIGMKFYLPAYHLISMHWEKSLTVKEFTGDKYVKLGKMTGEELRNRILFGKGPYVQQINRVPSYFVSPDADHPGKSMNEAQIVTEMVHDKHRAVVVGRGPEADLMYKNMVKKLGAANVMRIDPYSNDRNIQIEAKRFAADVILGVKRPTSEGSYERVAGHELGGIYIDPKPSKAGQGISELKGSILKSRPFDDTSSWTIELPSNTK